MSCPCPCRAGRPVWKTIRLWQLARLPVRRRLFLGQHLLQSHREAPCSGSHQAPAPKRAVKFAEREKQTVHIGSTWLDLKFSEKKAIINKLLVCSPNLVAAFFGSTHLQGGGHSSQILVSGASSWSVRVCLVGGQPWPWLAGAKFALFGLPVRSPGPGPI